VASPVYKEAVRMYDCLQLGQPILECDIQFPFFFFAGCDNEGGPILAVPALRFLFDVDGASAMVADIVAAPPPAAS
jgi:hypothetical protein